MIGRLVATAYVGTVAGVAVAGFAGDSTAAILTATALALPCGIVGLVGFYAAYGLLALVPGANPDESSGNAWCTADGVCTSTSSRDLATWFAWTTDAIGVTALAAAAVANVLLVYGLLRILRRGRATGRGRPPSRPGTPP